MKLVLEIRLLLEIQDDLNESQLCFCCAFLIRLLNNNFRIIIIFIAIKVLKYNETINKSRSATALCNQREERYEIFVV